MRIRLSELKRIIRSVVNECYGWPVEKELPLYGVKSKSWGAENPVDPANKKLKLPKGSNTKSKKNLKEGFRRITSRELSEWSKGNYGYLQENDMDEDGKLGEALPEVDEVDQMDEMDEMDEASCSECGGMKEVDEITGEASCSECGNLFFEQSEQHDLYFIMLLNK